MKVSFRFALALVGCFFMAQSSMGAEDKAKTEASKEVRVKMAEAHSKMAECLKSDKSFPDCRDEMRQSVTGNEEFGCGWGRGRGGRGAFSKGPAKEEVKKK